MVNFLKGRLVAVRVALLLAAGMLILIGIATIYSVGNPAESSPAGPGEALNTFWKKQIIFVVVGLAGFILVNVINYRWFGQTSYWIYTGVLLLLASLLFSKYIVGRYFEVSRCTVYHIIVGRIITCVWKLIRHETASD